MWLYMLWCCFFFVKQKTAYEMRISDWSSDVCSSDLNEAEEMIRTQATLLKEWLSSAEAHLVTNRIEVEKLASAISAADSQAGQLAEQAGPKLIEALLRVKDTAEQAAERARQSLARTIPEAADALGRSEEHTSELQSLLRNSY